MSQTGRIHPSEWTKWMGDADEIVAAKIKAAGGKIDGVEAAVAYYDALRARPLDLRGVRVGIAYAQRLMDAACTDTATPYDLDAVLGTPHGKEYVSFSSATMRLMKLSNAQVVNQGLEFWHRSTWKLAGRQVFDVSPGLGERLARTHLRGLATDDLRLPYHSIYLTVPKRAGLKVYNEETGWHALSGIYITEGTVPVRRNGYREGDPTTLTRGWRVMLWGLAKGVREFEMANERDREMLAEADDALFHFAVPLYPGMPIEESIEAVLQGAAQEGPLPGESKAVYSFFREAFKPTFQWMMNAVLYATWPGGEKSPFIPDATARALWEKHERSPKGTPKRRDALDRYRALPLHQQQRVTILGRGVRVMDEDASGQGIPLAVRTLVEGHWRHQHYGPKNTLVKRIWIQPFWRGPDDAPISTPIHRMVAPPAPKEHP